MNRFVRRDRAVGPRPSSASGKGGGSFPVPPIVIALYVVDLLFALAFTAQLVLGLSETGLIARQLHPGREANVPTWYSSMQWALAGAVLALYAVFPRPGLRGGIRLYLPVAAALALSLDEAAAIHEWIGGRSDALLPGGTREGTFFTGTGIWMLILVPVAIGAAIWVAHLLADHLRSSPSATRLLIAGGALFILGAGVIEVFSNVGVGNRPLQLGIQIVEEFAEMLGATTVVWGAFELLRVNDIRISRS